MMNNIRLGRKRVHSKANCTFCLEVLGLTNPIQKPLVQSLTEPPPLDESNFLLEAIASASIHLPRANGGRGSYIAFHLGPSGMIEGVEKTV